MLLDTRLYPQNDVRRFTIQYDLPDGFVIQSVTANITSFPGITSTVGVVQLAPNEKEVWVWVNFGTVLNEQFTVNVIAKDNFGETFNDTINCTVVAAGTT